MPCPRRRIRQHDQAACWPAELRGERRHAAVHPVNPCAVRRSTRSLRRAAMPDIFAEAMGLHTELVQR